MKILLVTDAWLPQTNGVVNTLRHTVGRLEARGHLVDRLSPEQFRNVPCPTYPEIRLSVLPGGALSRRIDALAPDAIHIATEGPLGMAARRHCLRRGQPVPPGERGFVLAEPERSWDWRLERLKGALRRRFG